MRLDTAVGHLDLPPQPSEDVVPSARAVAVVAAILCSGVIMPLIASHPDILGGKPCIAGTRISVAFLLELVATGATRAEVLRKYPQVTSDGFDAALGYAVSAVSRDQLWDLPLTA